MGQGEGNFYHLPCMGLPRVGANIPSGGIGFFYMGYTPILSGEGVVRWGRVSSPMGGITVLGRL